MSLVKWSLFNDLFPAYFANYDIKMPKFTGDWKEDENGLSVEIALPGTEKDKIQVYAENSVLVLKIADQEKHYSYSILRKVETVGYDIEKTEATYKDGLLKLVIPKFSEKKQKRIEIKVS